MLCACCATSRLRGRYWSLLGPVLPRMRGVSEIVSHRATLPEEVQAARPPTGDYDTDLVDGGDAGEGVEKEEKKEGDG